jgi:hypothetical protein
MAEEVEKKEPDKKKKKHRYVIGNVKPAEEPVEGPHGQEEFFR